MSLFSKRRLSNELALLTLFYVILFKLHCLKNNFYLSQLIKGCADKRILKKQTNNDNLKHVSVTGQLKFSGRSTTAEKCARASGTSPCHLLERTAFEQRLWQNKC